MAKPDKKRAPSPRWAMENKDGITCYVYAKQMPNHMISCGYKNLRPAGYYDHALNCIVGADERSEVIDNRKVF